jgi:hypothetical protein
VDFVKLCPGCDMFTMKLTVLFLVVKELVQTRMTHCTEGCRCVCLHQIKVKVNAEYSHIP